MPRVLISDTAVKHYFKRRAFSTNRSVSTPSVEFRPLLVSPNFNTSISSRDTYSGRIWAKLGWHDGTVRCWFDRQKKISSQRRLVPFLMWIYMDLRSLMLKRCFSVPLVNFIIHCDGHLLDVSVIRKQIKQTEGILVLNYLGVKLEWICRS